MENLIEIKNEYNSLDKLRDFLEKESIYDCFKTYDIWEMRTDSNREMKECIVIKKSGLHAVKAFFINENTVKINYIIPNKVMHAYFGKSVKARRNSIEIIAGLIKQTVLKGFQKKVFKELELLVLRAS